MKINYFCSRPPTIREFHQKVMKWQPWQHSHVAVIAPPPTFGRHDVIKAVTINSYHKMYI